MFNYKKIATLEARLESLEAENDSLKAQLDEQEDATTTVSNAMVYLLSAEPAPDESSVPLKPFRLFRPTHNHMRASWEYNHNGALKTMVEEAQNRL